jgi:hypothetical protein
MLPTEHGLIQAGNAREMLLRHHQRRRGLHGGPVERAADLAEQHHRVDVPHLDVAGPEQVTQAERRQRDGAVRHDHHHAAVPAIHVHARQRTQHDLGQHGEQRRQRQHSRRAGFFGQPPDQRKHGDAAARQRERLPAPDGKERDFPSICLPFSAHSSSAEKSKSSVFIIDIPPNVKNVKVLYEFF